MAENNYTAEVEILGIPDHIIEHGTLKELYAECKFDADSIAETARKMLQEKIKVKTTSLIN